MSRDERFTEPLDGVDDHTIAASRHGVRGEEHTRGAGVDHALDDDTHTRRAAIGTRRAIGARCVRVERREARFDGVAERVLAFDIELRDVLARERGVFAVFTERGGSHRDAAAAERPVRFGEVVRERVARGVHDDEGIGHREAERTERT